MKCVTLYWNFSFSFPDENGKVVGGTQEESDGESEFPNNKKFFPDEILGFRPSFTEITAPPFGSTFRPKVGSTLTLRCKVDGHPLPTVVWFRIRVSESDH